MTDPAGKRKSEPYRQKLTVGHVREPDPSGNIEVIFLESARFYRLLRNNPKFNDVLKRLRDAEKEKRPINAATASMESDIIEDVV